MRGYDQGQGGTRPPLSDLGRRCRHTVPMRPMAPASGTKGPGTAPLCTRRRHRRLTTPAGRSWERAGRIGIAAQLPATARWHASGRATEQPAGRPSRDRPAASCTATCDGGGRAGIAITHETRETTAPCTPPLSSTCAVPRAIHAAQARSIRTSACGVATSRHRGIAASRHRRMTMVEPAIQPEPSSGQCRAVKPFDTPPPRPTRAERRSSYLHAA